MSNKVSVTLPKGYVLKHQTPQFPMALDKLLVFNPMGEARVETSACRSTSKKYYILEEEWKPEIGKLYLFNIEDCSVNWWPEYFTGMAGNGYSTRDSTDGGETHVRDKIKRLNSEEVGR